MGTQTLNKYNSDFSETSLESLHAYSLFWLNEIEFWKDEVAFFYQLLRKKSEKHASDLKTEDAKRIEKHLIHTSVTTLNDLERDVLSHERFLSRIMENPDSSEKIFRDQHQRMYEKMSDFEREFRQLKKEIFNLAKDPGFHH